MSTAPEVVRVESADDGTYAEVVPELGGIVSSFVVPTPVGPRDLLFRHPFFFDTTSTETRGGIPILFPVCGRSMCDGVLGAWRHAGRVYPMPIHGFAMRRPWRLAGCGQSFVALRMEHDDVTRAMYPFAFTLDVRVIVGPRVLRIEIDAVNHDRAAMPFALGIHPYFAAPGPDGSVRFRGRVRHAYDATFCGFAQEGLPPVGDVAIEDPALGSFVHELGHERTAQLLRGDSSGVRLEFSGPPSGIDFGFLQLYRPAGAGFVCVEPWTAPPNALASSRHSTRLDSGTRVSGWVEIAALASTEPLSR